MPALPLLLGLALIGAPYTSGALAKTALKSNLGFLPDGWAWALGLLLPLAAVGTTAMMIHSRIFLVISLITGLSSTI